jgi:hypothetical protein
MQPPVELVQGRLDRSGGVRAAGITGSGLLLDPWAIGREPADGERELAVGTAGVPGFDRVGQFSPGCDGAAAPRRPS